MASSKVKTPNSHTINASTQLSLSTIQHTALTEFVQSTLFQSLLYRFGTVDAIQQYGICLDVHLARVLGWDRAIGVSNQSGDILRFLMPKVWDLVNQIQCDIDMSRQVVHTGHGEFTQPQITSEMDTESINTSLDTRGVASEMTAMRTACVNTSDSNCQSWANLPWFMLVLFPLRIFKKIFTLFCRWFRPLIIFALIYDTLLYKVFQVGVIYRVQHHNTTNQLSFLQNIVKIAQTDIQNTYAALLEHNTVVTGPSVQLEDEDRDDNSSNAGDKGYVVMALFVCSLLIWGCIMLQRAIKAAKKANRVQDHSCKDGTSMLGMSDPQPDSLGHKSGSHIPPSHEEKIAAKIPLDLQVIDTAYEISPSSGQKIQLNPEPKIAIGSGSNHHTQEGFESRSNSGTNQTTKLIDRFNSLKHTTPPENTLPITHHATSDLSHSPLPEKAMLALNDSEEAESSGVATIRASSGNGKTSKFPKGIVCTVISSSSVNGIVRPLEVAPTEVRSGQTDVTEPLPKNVPTSSRRGNIPTSGQNRSGITTFKNDLSKLKEAIRNYPELHGIHEQNENLLCSLERQREIEGRND